MLVLFYPALRSPRRGKLCWLSACVSMFYSFGFYQIKLSEGSLCSLSRIAWLTMGAKDWKLLHTFSEDWSGCAFWSVFIGWPYRKIHCLFVCFFITDNNLAIFISYGKRWSGFASSQNTSYPRHPTSQYTVDLSLPVTWIERSVYRAPRGSVDRQELKRTSIFCNSLSQAKCLTTWAIFCRWLPYQQVKLA